MQASPAPKRNAPSAQLDLEPVLDLLRSGRRFLLTGHSRPDGDCLGAEAALASALNGLGKQAQILNPDPLEQQYEFLTRGQAFGVFAGEPLPSHDVAVLLDFSDPRRSGSLAGPLAAAPSKKVVIDHHTHLGEPWWDAALLDVNAAATGVLVHRLVRALEAPLDLNGARGLFTSIVTDTGWFRYPNTDLETFRIAAELVELGVEPAEVHRALRQRKSRRYPAALGRLLSGVCYHAQGALAVMTIPHDADAAITDGDEALDILRSVGTVEVVLLVRELSDGSCKLSARSKTTFDVDELARAFGGGGHTRAAGARLNGPLERATDRLVGEALARLERDPGAVGTRRGPR